MLGSARQALARIVAGERFDVVLCDLMMPVMTGVELHAELLRVAPEVAERVVFMTGGAFTPATRELLARLPDRHVEKPLDAATLGSALRRLLPQ